MLYSHERDVESLGPSSQKTNFRFFFNRDFSTLFRAINLLLFVSLLFKSSQTQPKNFQKVRGAKGINPGHLDAILGLFGRIGPDKAYPTLFLLLHIRVSPLRVDGVFGRSDSSNQQFRKLSVQDSRLRAPEDYLRGLLSCYLID